MNKFTFTNLCMAIYCLCTMQLNAQDGYTYTLIHNGGYSFSVGAVPNASTSNFPTSVQSYGFTIIVPDGVTAVITSSLGNGAATTFFDGNNVGQPTIDGYLITETLGSPIALPAPSAATTTPMVTFEIQGTPTSGIIEILANNSALATAVTPLKSFMSADMEDDGSAAFSNRVDPNGSGLSGDSTFDFTTLSVTDIKFENLSIYPNPATDVVNINYTETPLQKIEIYNLNGKLLQTKTTQMERFQIHNLQAGMYLMKLYTRDASTTIKLIKQ
ncbi:T9SS type A sorting domain-containing protein [Kordia sp. TARA_039_SRF]|nr:T9SS type A sorting domain-containing protein [Kordia sp. TARA_039_SRF]